MTKVLPAIRSVYSTLGDNLISFILAAACIAILMVAQPAHAQGGVTCAQLMQEAELAPGDSIPCTMEVVCEVPGTCLSEQTALKNTVIGNCDPIVAEVNDKEACSITPHEAIENALKEQLEETP